MAYYGGGPPPPHFPHGLLGAPPDPQNGGMYGYDPSMHHPSMGSYGQPSMNSAVSYGSEYYGVNQNNYPQQHQQALGPTDGGPRPHVNPKFISPEKVETTKILRNPYPTPQDDGRKGGRKDEVYDPSCPTISASAPAPNQFPVQGMDYSNMNMAYQQHQHNPTAGFQMVPPPMHGQAGNHQQKAHPAYHPPPPSTTSQAGPYSTATSYQSSSANSNSFPQHQNSNASGNSATSNSNSPEATSSVKIMTGLVTPIQAGGFGMISEEIFFQQSAVAGSMPKVGDKVVVEAEAVNGMPFKYNAKRVTKLDMDLVNDDKGTASANATPAATTKTARNAGIDLAPLPTLPDSLNLPKPSTSPLPLKSILKRNPPPPPVISKNRSHTNSSSRGRGPSESSFKPAAFSVDLNQDIPRVFPPSGGPPIEFPEYTYVKDNIPHAFISAQPANVVSPRITRLLPGSPVPYNARRAPSPDQRSALSPTIQEILSKNALIRTRELEHRDRELSFKRGNVRSPSPKGKSGRNRSRSRSLSPRTKRSGKRSRSRSLSPRTKRSGKRSRSRSVSPRNQRSGKRSRSRSLSPRNKRSLKQSRSRSPLTFRGSRRSRSNSYSPKRYRSRSRSASPRTATRRSYRRSRSPGVGKYRRESRSISRDRRRSNSRSAERYRHRSPEKRTHGTRGRRRYRSSSSGRSASPGGGRSKLDERGETLSHGIVVKKVVSNLFPKIVDQEMEGERVSSRDSRTSEKPKSAPVPIKFQISNPAKPAPVTASTVLPSASFKPSASDSSAYYKSSVLNIAKTVVNPAATSSSHAQVRTEQLPVKNKKKEQEPAFKIVETDKSSNMNKSGIKKGPGPNPGKTDDKIKQWELERQELKSKIVKTLTSISSSSDNVDLQTLRQTIQNDLKQLQETGQCDTGKKFLHNPVNIEQLKQSVQRDLSQLKSKDTPVPPAKPAVPVQLNVDKIKESVNEGLKQLRSRFDTENTNKSPDQSQPAESSEAQKATQKISDLTQKVASSPAAATSKNSDASSKSSSSVQEKDKHSQKIDTNESSRKPQPLKKYNDSRPSRAAAATHETESPEEYDERLEALQEEIHGQRFLEEQHRLRAIGDETGLHQLFYMEDRRRRRIDEKQLARIRMKEIQLKIDKNFAELKRLREEFGPPAQRLNHERRLREARLEEESQEGRQAQAIRRHESEYQQWLEDEALARYRDMTEAERANRGHEGRVLRRRTPSPDRQRSHRNERSSSYDRQSQRDDWDPRGPPPPGFGPPEFFDGPPPPEFFDEEGFHYEREAEEEMMHREMEMRHRMEVDGRFHGPPHPHGRGPPPPHRGDYSRFPVPRR